MSRANGRGAFLEPMLATLGREADIVDQEDWAFEMKWDGIRIVATIDDATLRLVSRNGKDYTTTYPELRELLDVVNARQAVLDGEVVALDEGGRPDFGRLQTRMGLSEPADVARASRSVEVHYFVFDLLEVDGRSIMNADYDDRRARLESVIHAKDNGVVQVPPAFQGNLHDAVRTSRELGLEGVVAKERDGRYVPGRRSHGWIKIKHHRTQEVIVGGWRPGNGRRAGSIGSLLVGIPDAEGIRYVGRVGTGFADTVLDEIRSRLAERESRTAQMRDVPAADASDAHWVVPDLVGEVEFAEWTSAGRLRQPSWRGWRPDKSPSDVRVE